MALIHFGHFIIFPLLHNQDQVLIRYDNPEGSEGRCRNAEIFFSSVYFLSLSQAVLRFLEIRGDAQGLGKMFDRQLPVSLLQQNCSHYIMDFMFIGVFS